VRRLDRAIDAADEPALARYRRAVRSL
jgi:hypothetical protein